MSDLLADLQVDRARVPGPVPAAPAAEPVPAEPVPAEAAPRPALDLRVTPLHWARPRLALGRDRLELVAGPVRVALST